MRSKDYTIVILLSVLSTAFLRSQEAARDSVLSSEISFYNRLSNRPFQPYYMVFQNSGMVSDRPQDFLLRATIDQPFFLSDHFRWAWGLDVVSNFSRSDGGQLGYFHRAYIEASYYGIQIQLGYKPLHMGHMPAELSLGTFLSNQNYRTAPGVAIGVFDYISVPFTADYVKFKGSLEHYWMQEETSIKFYQKHRKTIYLGTQNLPLNIYAGIDHVVLFGGEHPKYGKLPSDLRAYKDVFFGNMQSQPTSNDALLVNETTNAYGNHLFTIEWGLDFKIGDYDVLFSYQKPGDDGSGLSGHWDWVYYRFLNNEDVFLGLRVKNENFSFLSLFTFEYVSTLHQSGRGLPEITVPNPKNTSQPITPLYSLPPGKSVVKELMSPPYIDFFAKKFGEHVRKFDEQQMLNFVNEVYNGGHHYGGRSTFYSNALYPNIYFGKTMGTPLLYTKARYERLRGVTSPYSGAMASNTMEGVSFGFKGVIYQIGYRALLTFTKNYGIIEFAYPQNGKKDADGDWIFNDIPDPSYFFSKGRQQNYLYLELNYENFPQEYWTNLSIDLAFSYDFGEIYHAFGTMLGISYHLL